MRRVSIASSSQIAADAGAAIADQGGNAFDAAVAGVIASMCTEPGIIAPGSGGFMTVWPAGQDPVVIDGSIEMPGRGLPADRFGGGLREIEMTYGGGTRTIVGHGSVGTPGAFAGLRLTWERYGSAPWASLFEPAIAAVEPGFPLSSAAAEYFAHSHEVVFGWDPSSYAVIHHPDGTHMVAGDVVHVPHLADSLRLIAAEGTDALYRGELGAMIVEAVQGGGGLLTRRDLAEYEAVVRSPIRVDIDEWAVATNPPPAVGGACMAAMLMLLGGGAFESWSADDIQTLIRVQRAVLTYRSRLFVDHERQQEAERLLELAGMGDLDGIISAPSTTHTSTVDSDGNACSITVSAGYGSGALVDGTGFWLNNSLGELELNPQGVHSLEPGTRLPSNMAPTVARSTRGAVLAIGSPGADRITTAISSVLLNFIHLGMALSDAVDHPRVHAEVFEGAPTAAYEPGIPVRPFDDVQVRRFPDLSMYFGGVQAVLFDPPAWLFEAADPRRAGGIAHGG